jgi:acyl carrier protein
MTSTADDVDQWDSITHIELITNVEKEFGIRFALGELQELKNVGEMVTLVGRKLN